MSPDAKRAGPPTEALYALAFRKLEQENYRDAACLLRLMLHVAPQDERAWLALGLCHERSGQPNVAKELYAAGSVAARPSGRCALACARVLDEQGNSELADDQYAAAVSAFDAIGDLELSALARSEMEAR